MSEYLDLLDAANLIVWRMMLRRIKAPFKFTVEVEKTLSGNRYWIVVGDEKWGSTYDLHELINTNADRLVLKSQGIEYPKE